MGDEDGNLTDNRATYSFVANRDVNVTIETPNGSWITPMWRYNNNPLPLVVRTNRNYDMTLKLDNQLDENTTIHWHGFKVPADMDGGPDFPVVSKSSKTYSFKMQQPSAPLWFHPHPDMQTGKQVYMGLAGVFLLEDNISKTLEAENMLPSKDKDVVLLVQDRRFGSLKNGVRELIYKNKSIDSDGMLGDTILVNGSVYPRHNVSTTQYRYRLYNVSNARNYDFAFSDGRKFKIVATDGGLLNEPVEVDHIKLGAAERVELVVDFSQDSIGSRVSLISKSFKADVMSRMMNNNSSDSGDGRLENGTELKIMQFYIAKEESDNISLYSTLPQTAEIAKRLNPQTADNVDKNREFVMSMYRGSGGMSSMVFAINGKLFDPKRIDEYIPANSTEIWSIKNTSPMAHPFHAHATQFQIIDRDGVEASGTDLGWKDTFLVKSGETIRIIGKFEEVNRGDYMYHCHILEHEDAGMMGYFRVGDSGHI
jgi:FtsP/CotA-like multicopper oxidase with cupredoxin domain